MEVLVVGANFWRQNQIDKKLKQNYFSTSMTKVDFSLKSLPTTPGGDN